MVEHVDLYTVTRTTSIDTNLFIELLTRTPASSKLLPMTVPDSYPIISYSAYLIFGALFEPLPPPLHYTHTNAIICGRDTLEAP